MRLLRRSSLPPVPPNADEAQWSLVESLRDGQPMWVRHNLALRDRLPAPSHPLLVSVRVACDQDDPEQLARLGGFETALFGILGQEDLCWAAAVVTLGDSRWFLLYAREREALIPRLAFLKQEFPLDFAPGIQDDPDGSVLRRLTGSPAA